jgi:CubicO group peptidase (beta-lactamase class C family)
LSCDDAERVTIDDFLRREIALGSFPSASYAIGSSKGIDRIGAHGSAVAVPLRIPATVDTIYDCASITKALVTTTLVLRERALDDVIHGYTVRELLTHTSGLRAWMPLYAFDDPIRTIIEQGPECDRGTRVIYSDLNFILLWSAIENYDAKAAALGALVKPPPSLKPRMAATEWGQLYEMKMVGRVLPMHRRSLIWGETHDGNSHHVGGGCAGNAGLFATATEVFEMTRTIVNDPFFRDAITNQTPDMEDGFGWHIGTGSAATEMLSPGNFGHTGFTGTSVWVDRERDKIMVLLTNRVHPCAAPVSMLRIRGEFHRLAIAGE